MSDMEQVVKALREILAELREIKGAIELLPQDEGVAEWQRERDAYERAREKLVDPPHAEPNLDWLRSAGKA